MIISDHKFQEFINNIPFEKKVFLLHGTLYSKIWYFRKLLENKLVGPRALEQMKLVFIDRSLIHKDKNINTSTHTYSLFARRINKLRHGGQNHLVQIH